MNVNTIQVLEFTEIKLAQWNSLLSKGHPFFRAFMATIDGWPLMRGIYS